MGFFRKLFGHETEAVDYYDEGIDLLNAGKYHEALVSFRLALRDAPSDADVLQQIAITYTRIGMGDEAIRTYRKALTANPAATGAHYGLAFLLLHAGQRDEAADHLRAFLTEPPAEPDAQRHVDHARRTLTDIEAGGALQTNDDPTAGAIP